MLTPSDVPPTVQAQLSHATRILAEAGLPAAHEDALALLSRVLGVSAAVLGASETHSMSASAVAKYIEWIERRAEGVAIPYITGHLTFMDLELAIGEHSPLLPVYAPRIVEAALQWARGGQSHDLIVAEIGTGCGAVALALAAFEPRFSRIYAIDPSTDSLRTAAANGARYLLNLVVSWLEGDGPDAMPETVDLLVSAQCGDVGDPRFAALAERAPVSLRPGGALICGLDSERSGGAVERIRQSLPHAQIWLESQSDGIVVVAQLPRSAVDDAAFDTRR